MDTLETGSQPPWGHYAPPHSGRYLRSAIKLGLSRGKLRKIILARWARKFGNIIDVSIRGVNYRLDLTDNVTDRKIFAASKIYDGPEIDALSRASKDGVFIDIGANIGYYALSVAQRVSCKVMAIEPNPITLARLSYNVSINPDLQTRINIVSSGIGNVGTFDLHYANSLGTASLHKSLFDETATSVKIKTQPLLTMLNQAGITHVSAIKIDIEGMEDMALIPFFKHAPHALWPRCLVIEDAHQHLWTHDLTACLKACGYHLSRRNKGNAIWAR